MKTLQHQSLQFRSGCLSPEHSRCQLELESDKMRLARIANLHINASVTKQGHRYYIVDVTRHRTSAHAEPSTYQLEFRHSMIRLMCSQIRHICSEHAPQCTACGDMVDILRQDHIEPSRMQHCLPVKIRCSRMEKFLSVVLSHTVNYAAQNAEICVGCERNVRLVAEILKEKYFNSCGLI